MPGKPATTGVPYPDDPVPVSDPSIPNPTTTPPPPQPQPIPQQPQPQPTAPAGPYHVVVKGDTLYALSRKYGTSVARIKQLNNLASDNIKIGQVLRIQ